MQDRKLKLIKCGNHSFGIFDNEILGEGGSAVVKKGYNINNPSELFAVKIVNIQDQERKELALKELEAIKDLPVHPNLVRIQKIKVQSETNIYIFMEYCNGGTLFDLVRKRRMTEEQIYDMFCQLMRGYKVMHDAKVIHEDIKMENILIHDNLFKISDFGLAILSDTHKYGQKRKGTISYMPYQKLAKRDYTANVKSDIYSFGVLFYEVVCGRHPYISGKPDVGMWIKAMKDATVKNDVLVRYSVRFHSFFKLILRMLEKFDNDRISFPQLWEAYNSLQVLQPFRSQKPVANKIKTDIPLNYENCDIISMSHASIMVFGKSAQQIELEKIEPQCEYNQKIAHFIEIIIRSLENFSDNKEERQCKKLELLLHLTRDSMMKSVNIDWLSAPPLVKQICERYSSDCTYVKEELYHFLSEYPDKEDSKEFISVFRSCPSSEEVFQLVKTTILSLFKSRFQIVRINYSKQIQLLFYLVCLVKLIESKQVTIERLTEIQREGEEDVKIKPEIQKFLEEYEVIFEVDQAPEKELSEEFQLLIFDE